jgi:hypothetical protein
MRTIHIGILWARGAIVLCWLNRAPAELLPVRFGTFKVMKIILVPTSFLQERETLSCSYRRLGYGPT